MLDSLRNLVERAKFAWVAISLALGSIASGVSYLMGEGSARASYSAILEDHTRRIVALEEGARVAREQNTQIISLLGELRGEMRSVRAILTRQE